MDFRLLEPFVVRARSIDRRREASIRSGHKGIFGSNLDVWGSQYDFEAERI